MASSARLQEIIIKHLSDEQNHSVQEIKAYLAESGVHDYSEGQFSGSINTLLRNGTIKKIDRGVYAYNKGVGNMKKCFVVSPIGNVRSDIRNSADKLFKYIIKPVCENCGFNAIRVDQINASDSITQTIVDNLETADLVIADISGHNPNVFFEIGFRTRTKRPIVYLKPVGESLPFDINTIRTFDYDLTDLDSVSLVKERLEQTINSFEFSSEDNDIEEDSREKIYEPVIPILYQILDSISDLKSEISANNTDILGTVIRTMQSAQPQMSAETAMQTQLMSAFLQNPDRMMKLAELADKFPQKKR
jgi:nucleoside 2-deoxyribosyltransferase